ncbi:hypothetical protein N2152v2_001277 [Parachlorella kessleri]
MTGDASLLGGKTVLITGASKGVGAAIACAFAQEKATLVLVGRSQEGLQEVADRCWGVGAALVDLQPCDLHDPAAIDKLADAVLQKYGCIDVLVNVAGVYPDNVSLLEGDLGEWMNTVWVNLDVPMRMTRLFAPAMVKKGGGCIINMGSVAAQKGVPDEAAYSASKFGIRGWSYACYEALRAHNIKVCHIMASHIDTNMAHKQQGTRCDKVIPENMIQPEDVAEAALLPLRMTAVPAEITLNKMHSAIA